MPFGIVVNMKTRKNWSAADILIVVGAWLAAFALVYIAFLKYRAALH